MIRAPILRSLTCALLLVAAADAASAQELSLRLGRSSRHGSASLTIGLPVRACAPARVWVPGRYELRVERVWIEGCERRIWVPARYEWRRDPCGREVRVLVCAGHWRTVRDPGRFENREVRVWVPGHWREAPRY